jgi:hypothetical protein
MVVATESKGAVMAGIDDVLERLITDLGFRRRLREDPAAALAGYDLDEADLELLASQLDDGGGQAHAVEQRTSKSALFGLLAGLQEPSIADVDRPSAGRAVQAWVTVQNSSRDAPTELASGVGQDAPVADDLGTTGGIGDRTSSTAGETPSLRRHARLVDYGTDVEGADAGTGYAAEPDSIGEDEGSVPGRAGRRTGAWPSKWALPEVDRASDDVVAANDVDGAVRPGLTLDGADGDDVDQPGSPTPRLRRPAAPGKDPVSGLRSDEDSAIQPRQSSFEFLAQSSSDDAPPSPASGDEPDGPAADAPVKLGDIRDDTSSTASEPPASREGLRNLAKPLDHPGEGPATPKLQQSAVHGKDTAPEGHSDWIPLQAVGGEESAGGPVFEDVVVVREVDSVGEAHGTEATTGVGSDPAAGAEQAEAISRTSPDTFDPNQAD